jgi:hypothetical protein
LDSACDGGGAVMSHTIWHIEELGDPEEHRYFVTVESDFYCDLGRYYEARFDDYISAYQQRKTERAI